MHLPADAHVEEAADAEGLVEARAVVDELLAPAAGVLLQGALGQGQEVAAALHDAGLRLDRVFTSPLVRATQTAEILAAHGGFEGPLSVWSALAGGTTAMALAALDEALPEETMALVGHEPLVRAMVSRLAGVPSMFGFRTGGTCLVELRGDRGEFRWMLDPRTLERVSKVEDLGV